MKDKNINLHLPIIFIFTIITGFSVNSYSQNTIINNNNYADSLWVDSVFNSLSTDEKIAQLFMLRANNPGGAYFEEVSEYIKKYNIGGITFYRSTPHKQAQQTNYWQSIAKTPLLISIDAEYGLAMRLDNIISFPYQITLGAIQNDSLIYLMGREIGKQCNFMGIHMNFAPVVDINNNPDNPVINSRSFGENRYNVYLKGKAYAKGLKRENIIATAKHFPGHGDTDIDSHLDLPVIGCDYNRLDSLELFPFRYLIKDSIDAIMTAHLYIPSLEKEKDKPSTLSRSIVTELLRNKLGFDGLIVTDALEMKGVTKYTVPGDIEVQALLAGNDILLLPEDLPKAMKKIKQALRKDIISEEMINDKCKKILKYKYRAGLNKRDTVTIKKDLLKNINTSYANYLNNILYKEAITLVKNKDRLVPLTNIDTLKIASLSISENNNDEFGQLLSRYAKVDGFAISKNSCKKDKETIINQLRDYNVIIIAVRGTNIRARENFGITKNAIDIIDTLSCNKKVILDIFANPYSLGFLDNLDNIECIIVSYQDNYESQNASSQIIFGGIPSKGKLPVTASEEFPLNTGLRTHKIRLEYNSPEAFNIRPSDLKKIDSIALSGIENEAYPGCQVLAAKNGKIFYNKTFGYHTYAKTNPVMHDDIYDIASITKIAATTLAIMKLYKKGKLDIDDRIGKYLPFFRNSEKNDIIIRELMAHQAGMKAWIPYYLFTLDKNGHPDSLIYRTEISEEYPVRLAENIYIKENYAFKIFYSILLSPPNESHGYQYSDLGFYLLSRIIENVTNQPFEEYVEKNFYIPMGMSSTTFRPRRKFELNKIVPTENDKYFRMQLLHGDVHDPGAAMLGGVSGHAGLFSNSTDLAKLMYMLLQNGYYGGEKYLDSTIINEFTKSQFPLNLNRRGIGFDKPPFVYEKDGPVCKSASEKSYGHSGYTGTYVWADPEEDLIYVFLSNRIHPDANNTKILDLNIRTNLHQAIYDALKNSKADQLLDD